MATQANSKTSAAKSAPIIRQGHTTDGNYGSDPMTKGKGQKPVRDLTVKGR